jgi:hypothetical protein
MPALQKHNSEVPVGLKITPSKHSRKEIQDIAYLLANGQISERTAMEMYEKLLKAGSSNKNTFLRKVLKELFPNLGA